MIRLEEHQLLNYKDHKTRQIRHQPYLPGEGGHQEQTCRIGNSIGRKKDEFRL